eukprot:3935715-Rhodomonas_salina.1
MLLHARYAQSGTEIGYAATRHPLPRLRSRRAICTRSATARICPAPRNQMGKLTFSVQFVRGEWVLALAFAAHVSADAALRCRAVAPGCAVLT